MTYNETVPIATMLDAHFADQPKGAQQHAAKLANVSGATMSKWRKGTQIPEEYRAPELAALLDVSEDEVVQAIALQRRLRPRPPLTEPEELAEWRQSVDRNLETLGCEIRKLSQAVREAFRQQQRGE